MEDSRSKKLLTADSEMEDKCGSNVQGDITMQLSGTKKPHLSPSLSSSKPPLGPVPLLLKNPNNNSPSLPAIEAASANSEQDKNEQRQTPESSSAPRKKNNNVLLNDASSDRHHHESSNLETNYQHEPTKVSDPSDARKLKRVMSNRMSAHRSRLRKLEHVTNLERQCAQLEKQITLLQPQVEAFANLKRMLMLEQTVLAQRVQALENERLLKQGEIERNQAEVYRLREIEKRQKETEAQAMMACANWDTLPNNQHLLISANIIPAPGFQNAEGTSLGMEVDDEQTMNYLNSVASMNELDAIVNPPKLSDNNNASSELRFYF